MLSFFYAMALGGAFCIFYDILRALRKTVEHKDVWVFLGDVLFWVLAANISFLFMLAQTNGEIRGFVLLAELLGFALIRLIASKYFLWFFSFVLSKIALALRTVNRLIYAFCTFFETFLSKVFEFFKKILKSLLKGVKKLLKNMGRLLYTEKNNLDSEQISDVC